MFNIVNLLDSTSALRAFSVVPRKVPDFSHNTSLWIYYTSRPESHLGLRSRLNLTPKRLEAVCSTQYVECVQKKRPKCFFGNIFYKTRAILIKFGTLFPE